MYSSAYVWGKILGYLESRLTAPVVSTWFDDTEVMEFTDSRLVIFSPSPFRKETIALRLAHYVKDAMKELFDKDIELVVLGEEDLESYRRESHKMDFLDFNPQFTFEKFVVGSSNRFAHAAALSVATDPVGHNGEGNGYNPLLIYGPSGLGKTHLLYAIASKVHKDRPDFNIVYVKAEQFTNELIASIQNKTNKEFREKYRSADLLLMDDIQFIAGKETTQEEYFHTFNELYENRKQIVMTADRPPSAMSKLEERLRTRFEWGLTVDISPPDYETRMAILNLYSNRMGLYLPFDVIGFIAENITTDVRKLEGALKQLKAAYDMEHIEIDLSYAAKVLKNIKPDGKTIPTAELILSEVCNFYSLEEAVLRSKLKTKTVSEARQVAMYLMQTLANYSTEDIGRELNRDHTTVIHGCRKIKAMSEDRNTGIPDNLRDIISNINGKL